MLKLTYLLVFFIGASLVSCEKKVAAPAQSTSTPPVTKDTLSGRIYTVAGNGYDSSGKGGYSGDGGPAIQAELYAPRGVFVDAQGNMYIADMYNERIRKVTPQGIITTIAGNGGQGYSGDGGPATAAEFYYPATVTVDAAGNVYISDYNNNCIRKVNTSGIISTYAGKAALGFGSFGGDGGPADSALLSEPAGLATDNAGNLYIADDGNDRIRKVSANGIISTIAGGGKSGDGVPATESELNAPYGVAVDAAGNIYIASVVGNRIRKINTNGIISTVAGDGNPLSSGYSGDGGPAVNAELNNPTDVVVDNAGNIYIADADNYCIRMVNTNGIISTYAGNTVPASNGKDGSIAVDVAIGYLASIALDSKGNLYLADVNFNRVRVVYK